MRSVTIWGAHRWRVTFRKASMRPWVAVRTKIDPLADDDKVARVEGDSLVPVLAKVAPFLDNEQLRRILALEEAR